MLVLLAGCALAQPTRLSARLVAVPRPPHQREAQPAPRPAAEDCLWEQYRRGVATGPPVPAHPRPAGDCAALSSAWPPCDSAQSTDCVEPAVALLQLRGARPSLTVAASGAGKRKQALAAAATRARVDDAPGAAPELLARAAELSIVLLAAAGVAVLVGFGVSRTPPAEASNRGLLLHALFAGVHTMSCSAFIPEAMLVTRRFGGTDAGSGWLIGAPALATVLNTLLVVGTFATRPERAPGRMRGVCVLCCGGMVAVQAWSIYLLVSARGGYNSFLASRLAFGVANAPAAFFFTTLFAEPGDERANAFARLFTAMMVGVGLGPLVSCGAQRLLPGVETVVRTPLVLLVLQAMLLVNFALHFPSFEGAPFYPDEIVEIPSTPTGSRQRTRAVFISIGLSFMLLRSIAAASLEGGTAMILEKQFGWTVESVGLACSLSFLAVIPFKILHGYLLAHAAVAPVTVVRSFLALALLGSVCCFPRPLGARPAGAGLLLGGSTLIFPSLYLASATLSDLTMSLAGGDGVFSRGGVAVLLPVAMNIGRFLGPPLARAVLAGSGREAYAHVQVGMMAFSWLLLEAANQSRGKAPLPPPRFEDAATPRLEPEAEPGPADPEKPEEPFLAGQNALCNEDEEHSPWRRVPPDASRLPIPQRASRSPPRGRRDSGEFYESSESPYRRGLQTPGGPY